MPLAAGVFAFESEALSAVEFVAVAFVIDRVGRESFDGDSSLTDGMTKVCKALVDNCSVMTRVLFFADDDFRRALEATEDLVADSMMILVMRSKSARGIGMAVAGFKVKSPLIREPWIAGTVKGNLVQSQMIVCIFENSGSSDN